MELLELVQAVVDVCASGRHFLQDARVDVASTFLRFVYFFLPAAIRMVKT